MEVAKPRQNPQSASANRKKGGLCRLFNKAPGCCLYGDQCIFINPALSATVGIMDGETAQRDITIRGPDGRGSLPPGQL